MHYVIILTFELLNSINSLPVYNVLLNFLYPGITFAQVSFIRYGNNFWSVSAESAMSLDLTRLKQYQIRDVLPIYH